MTIAIIGQQKYEYQDLVCIYLALPFLSTRGFTLRAEPDGGEDADLMVSTEDFSGYLEVQVKGSENPITMDDLAEWLSHFPARSASGCLLERLKDDSSRVAMFVCSGRARDDLANLVVRSDWTGGTHEAVRWNREQARRFLNAFGSQYASKSEETRLHSDRRLRCQGLRGSITDDEIRSISQRLLILEQLTADVAYDLCSTRLRERYLVPAGQIQAVALQLEDVIRASKGTGENAAIGLQTALSPFLSDDITPKTYQRRGDEAMLLEALLEKRVLLLAGIPRCGKTYTGQWIAGEFQKKGYHVGQGSDIEEAERFLLEPSAEERLFLLDDPLGSTGLVDRANEKLTRIKHLYGRLSHHRRLIIAQRKDLLFEATSKPTLAGCTIESNKWFDLSQPPVELLLAIWTQLSTEGAVPKEIQDTIRRFLLSGMSTIEAGCLRHLAFNWHDLPDSPSLERVLHFAREEAHDVARTMIERDPAMSKLLIALAVSTMDSVPVHRRELAFVMSNTTNRPGLTMSIGRTIIFGREEPSISFPEYDEDPFLVLESLNALDRLEQRRFVDNVNEYLNYTMPFYRSVAEALISSLTAGRFDLLKGIAIRGLSCLGPRTTLSVIRNLSKILTFANLDTTQRRELIDVGAQALNSIFPATRDNAVLFMSDHVNTLEDERQKEVYTQLSSVFVDPSEIRWLKGTPWILPDRTSYGFSGILSDVIPSEKGIGSYLQGLGDQTRAQAVPAEAAFKVTKYLFAFPGRATTQVVLRLLNYDEAIIRAECARAWLCKDHGNDNEVLDSIFTDRHPTVALAACKAVLNSWEKYSPYKQENVFRRLSAMASSPIIAASLMRIVIVFDRKEHFAEGKSWTLWGRLFSVILEALPTRARFDESRFFNVMREASKNLPSETIMDICSAWADWVIRELHDGLPNEFGLGITEILMEIGEANISRRKSIVLKLIKVNDTGATMSFLRDLVDSWDRLSVDEREAVTTLFTTDRADVLWLQAVAITRKHVPGRIQEIVLGVPAFLNKPAAELIDQIPADLLANSVAVYCGHPQPLWYIGTHHSENTAWIRVISELQRRPSHKLFEFALNEALDSSDNEKVATIIRNVRIGHEDELFSLLLTQKVRCRGDWHGKAWVELLSNPPTPDHLGGWMERMAGVAPGVLDDIWEVRLWIPDKDLAAKFLEYLRIDLLIIAAAMKLQDISGSVALSEAVEILKLIEQQYRNQPPRILGTHNRVQTAMKKLAYMPEEITEIVESARRRTIEESRSIYERFKERTTQLNGWLSLVHK